MTATDSFNPTDAEGLAAWFARAEDNATRLRRRLIVLGGLAPWRDLPEPEPLPEPMCQGPKSGPAARGTAQTHNSPCPCGHRRLQAPETDPGDGDRTGGHAVGEAKRRKLAGSYPIPTDASVDPMPVPQEPEHPLVLALQATKAGDEVALAEALAIIDRMPDVIRERLLSAFAAFRKFDDAP